MAAYPSVPATAWSGWANPSRLLALFEQERTRGPFDSLFAADNVVRARADAERRDLAASLARDLDPAAPIPVLKRSVFRGFAREGRRLDDDRPYLRKLDEAVLSTWLGNPHLDMVQDRIWAMCETTWWRLAAHEGYTRDIDLLAASTAERLAFYVTALRDVLEPEVRERVVAEVRRRVLVPFLSPSSAKDFWRTRHSNWNAVVHGRIITAALALEDDLPTRAAIVARALGDLPCYLAGFTADGGCTEGVGYWSFGFDSFLRAGWALREASGGAIDILADPMVGRICRFPFAQTIRPGMSLTYGDGGAGHLSAAMAARIDRSQGLPEVFALCKPVEGRTEIANLDDLLLAGDRELPPWTDAGDHVLPHLGTAMLRMGRVTVGVKGGHNGENHNHNDIGSFTVHRGSTHFIADPGAPVYERDTFIADKRYLNLFTGSRGHSAPVIAGRHQLPGADRRATLEVHGANGGGERVATVEFAGAYDAPGLHRLEREIRVPAGGGPILVTDRFDFSGDAPAIEEVFITLAPASLDGDGVAIDGGEDGVVRLRAIGCAGSFRIDDMREESRVEITRRHVRRLVFLPDRVEPGVPLRFAIAVG